LAGARIPNLAGIKFTNDNLGAYASCLKHDGGRFDIPWGIDEKLVDALAAGAMGAVGSSYNFAAPLYQALIAAFRAGDMERARDLQRQSVGLIESLYAVGYFGAAKALMSRLGVPVGPARCPLDNPTPRQLDDLWRKLDGFPWFDHGGMPSGSPAAFAPPGVSLCSSPAACGRPPGGNADSIPC
jgi:N-acetylneuraminate lyase